MASFNKVTLLGNVTRDIELRTIPGGKSVCDLGLAVNDRVKRGEQWVEETTFVECSLFGRTAEIASEYLKKGSSVLIDGRLKLDTWQGNDGEKRSKLKVIGEQLVLLGGKGDAQRGRQSDAEYSPPADDDDRSRRF